METAERLQTLIHHGTRPKPYSSPEEIAGLQDDVSALSPAQRRAWARFLSSIATTESVEETIIQPLSRYFREDADVVAYLRTQSDDEQRHHRLFVAYIRQTFGHEKKRKSAADVFFYDTLFAGISRAAESRPLVFLAMLHFYEAFSLSFYKVLKERATRDSLGGLTALIQSIERDESRHLAGLEVLIRLYLTRKARPAGLAERLAIRAVLGILLADINQSVWALHNRHVRRNLAVLGIDPALMNRDALKAARASLDFVRNGM